MKAFPIAATGTLHHCTEISYSLPSSCPLKCLNIYEGFHKAELLTGKLGAEISKMLKSQPTHSWVGFSPCSLPAFSVTSGEWGVEEERGGNVVLKQWPVSPQLSNHKFHKLWAFV